MPWASRLAHIAPRHSLPLPQVRQRVEEVLGFVGLSEHIDKQPSALSGGQRRRGAIALSDRTVYAGAFRACTGARHARGGGRPGPSRADRAAGKNIIALS